MVPTNEKQLPIPGEFIAKMKATKQNPRYHAEGNVYNHTLLVLEKFHTHVDEFVLTAEEREVLFWAAILHDIGKPEVTRWKNGRWVSSGHEEAGVPIAKKILEEYHPEITLGQRTQILDLVRWHYIPLRWGLRHVPIDQYRQLSSITNFRLLGIFAYFDILGRLCEQKEQVLELIRHFNESIVPQLENESNEN